MPYIPKEDRERAELHPRSPGELNFAFTQTINEYLNAFGESYTIFNDIVGALEGAKLELYRRKISPYEDGKIAVNGDVY